MRTITRRGLARDRSLQPRPQPSSVPGLKFSTTTSQRERDRAGDVAALRPAQVDRDQPLVAEDARGIERLAAEVLAHGAHGVAVGRLDLDDLGAEVGEQAPAERAGDRRAHLQHAHAGQRTARKLCRRVLRPWPGSKHVVAEAHQGLLGASQVLPLQPLGLGRVAAAHGGEHGLVLAQARPRPAPAG